MKRTFVPHPLDLNIVDSSCRNVLEDWNLHLKDFHSGFAVFFEANLLSLALRSHDVRSCIRQADWIFPDGVAVSKLASLHAKHPVERISGPTFILKACEYGQSRGWKHFFYGGTPESLEVLKRKLREQFPAIIIAGGYAPPFRPLTPEEDAAVIKQINDSGADFVWVGLGGPKQEFWIQAHRSALKVPVMLGVGAAFDFHSGKRSWAPEIIRRLGLEWFWRMCSGGRRTLFRNLRCVSIVSLFLLKERIRASFRKRSKS